MYVCVYIYIYIYTHTCLSPALPPRNTRLHRRDTSFDTFRTNNNTTNNNNNNSTNNNNNIHDYNNNNNNHHNHNNNNTNNDNHNHNNDKPIPPRNTCLHRRDTSFDTFRTSIVQVPDSFPLCMIMRRTTADEKKTRYPLV